MLKTKTIHSLQCVATIALFVTVTYAFHAQGQANPSAVISHRTELEAQLKQYEQQIRETQQVIAQKRIEVQSLGRDIAIYEAKIEAAKLAIKIRTINIQNLGVQIKEKTEDIAVISDNLADIRVSLAESLRQISEFDQRSAIELAFQYSNLSEFFNEAESFTKLQTSVHEAYANYIDLKIKEEIAREALETNKQEELAFRSLQELEKKDLEKEEKKLQNLLKITRGKESEYKKLLTNQQKNAASIRSQLFLLQGSPAIPFEKALEYANFASQTTGVRPAFILAIIAQESELGKNIGQCNLPNDPPQYRWQSVMKPERDHAPYLAITAELGLDPNQMPVSCPLRDAKKNRIGWGGAMGPAQFIPSTWILYKQKVAGIVGHNPPNPWNAQDAFVASALLSKDNGASKTLESERIAAAKYFAGGNWNSSLGRSYANQVLARIDDYQEQIDILSAVGN